MGLTLGAGFTFFPAVLLGVAVQNPVLWCLCHWGTAKGGQWVWMWPHPQGDEFLRVGSLGCSPPPRRGFVGGSWGAASFPAGYGMGLGVLAGHCGEGLELLGYRICPGGKGRRCPPSAGSSPALGWRFHSAGCGPVAHPSAGPAPELERGSISR